MHKSTRAKSYLHYGHEREGNEYALRGIDAWGLDILIIDHYGNLIVQALLRRLKKLNPTLFFFTVSNIFDKAAEHEKHEFAVHVLRECMYSSLLFYSSFYLLFLMFTTDCFRLQVQQLPGMCSLMQYND